MPGITKLSASEARSETGICLLAAALGDAFSADIRYEVPHSIEGDLMRIDLTLNESNAAIFTSLEAAKQIARKYFDLTSDYPIPDSLQAAAMEYAAESLLNRIEEISVIKVQVRGLRQVTSPSDTKPLSSFRITAPDWPIHTVHFASVDGPLKLPAFPFNTRQHDIEDLPLRFPLEIGHCNPSLTDLRRLAPGDILLVRSPELIARSMAFISLTSRHGVTVAIDGTQLTTIKFGRIMTTEPNDPEMLPADGDHDGTITSDTVAVTDDADHGDAIASTEDQPIETFAADPLIPPETIEDVRLRLSFDLGEIELTIGELSNLVAGQSFDLANLPERAVRIRLNNNQIGTGEIVEIGNRIGVRVNELKR